MLQILDKLTSTKIKTQKLMKNKSSFLPVFSLIINSYNTIKIIAVSIAPLLQKSINSKIATTSRIINFFLPKYLIPIYNPTVAGNIQLNPKDI